MIKNLTIWTLEEALTEVRKLQPLVEKYNYHITIGGSVINSGSSMKDLDLYFHPLDNGDTNLTDALVEFLTTQYGELEQISEII